MFAHELHVRPWELDRLTVDEVRQAIAEFDRMIAESNRHR